MSPTLSELRFFEVHALALNEEGEGGLLGSVVVETAGVAEAKAQGRLAATAALQSLPPTNPLRTMMAPGTVVEIVLIVFPVPTYPSCEEQLNRQMPN